MFVSFPYSVLMGVSYTLMCYKSLNWMIWFAYFVKEEEEEKMIQPKQNQHVL